MIDRAEIVAACGPRILIRDVVSEVAEATGHTVEELLGQSREGDVTRARQYAMWRARKLTRASFPQIGRVFGRDHSTVLHACRVVEQRLQGVNA